MWRKNWWWKLLSGAFVRDRIYKIIKYFAELPNVNSPYSSHRAVNVTWGLGSFILYFTDHFVFKRGPFSRDELLFMMAMAGIQTTSALISKRFRLNASGQPDSSTEVEDVTTSNKSSK